MLFRYNSTVYIFMVIFALTQQWKIFVKLNLKIYYLDEWGQASPKTQHDIITPDNMQIFLGFFWTNFGVIEI